MKFVAAWIAKKQIAPTVYEVIFQTSAVLADYLPGQYINMDFGVGDWRSFSIVDTERKSDVLKFKLIVEILPNGLASDFFLNSEAKRQELACIGPVGRFVSVQSPRKKVFVATNTGLAPVSAIIAAFQESGEQNMTLIFGCKTREYDYSFDYVDRQNVEKIVCVSQDPSAPDSYKQGRVTDHIPSLFPDPKNYDWYVCGNPNMVSDVVEYLRTKSIPNNQIVTEKFLLKPQNKML